MGERTDRAIGMWNRTTKGLLVLLFVLSMLFVVQPLRVHSCSCAGPPSIEDQLSRKTAIFTGKVRSVTEPAKGKLWSTADEVKVQFEVKRVWKGEVSSRTTVYTARSSSSCGYEGFEADAEFIVFAYGDPDHLETGLCEGNKTLAFAQTELQALGEGYEPSQTPMPQEENRSIIIPAVVAAALTLIVLGVVVWKRKRNHA